MLEIKQIKQALRGLQLRNLWRNFPFGQSDHDQVNLFRSTKLMHCVPLHNVASQLYNKYAHYLGWAVLLATKDVHRHCEHFHNFGPINFAYSLHLTHQGCKTV